MVITTKDRPRTAGLGHAHAEPRNYLAYTIDGLMRHGGCGLLPTDFVKVTIFDSGSNDTTFVSNAIRRWKEVEFVDSSKNLTIVENTVRALFMGAQDSEYVCLVQDDVCFKWWLFFALPAWLEKHEHPDLAYVSLTRVPGRIGSDYAECHPESVPSACCLVFKSETLSGLFAHPVCKTWAMGFRVDHMLRCWALATNRSVISPLASWVQHIGDNSNLGARPVRRAGVFDPAPCISAGDVRRTLQTCRGRPHQADFAALFPGGIPSRNRLWEARRTDNGLEIQHRTQALSLNSTGELLWNLCCGKRTYENIITTLTEAFVVSREQLAEGVDELLFELAGRGALCIGRDTPGIGITPLMRACAGSDADEVERLVQECGNVNVVDSLNRCALHYAAESSNPEIFRLLRQYGARTDITDHLGRTPNSIRAESSSSAP